MRKAIVVLVITLFLATSFGVAGAGIRPGLHQYRRLFDGVSLRNGRGRAIWQINLF